MIRAEPFQETCQRGSLDGEDWVKSIRRLIRAPCIADKTAAYRIQVPASRASEYASCWSALLMLMAGIAAFACRISMQIADACKGRLA